MNCKINFKSSIFKIKKKEIVDLALFLVLWIAAINYSDNIDFLAYYRDYNSFILDGVNANVGYEFLFNSILYIFSRFKLPFRIVYALCISFVLLNILHFFSKNINNFGIPFLALTFYPLVHYLIQLRSALGTAFVIIGIQRLANVKSNKVKRRIEFIICVLLASMFHISCMIFLFLLLADIFNKNVLKRCIIAFYIIIPFVISAIYSFLYKLILKTPIYGRVYYYMKESISIQKYTLFIIAMYFLLFLLLIVLDFVTKKKKGFEQMEIYYKCSLLICLTSSCSFFTVIADRIPAMLLPVVYLVLAKYWEDNKNKMVGLIALLGMIMFALAYCVFFFGPWNVENYTLLTEHMWKTEISLSSLIQMAE